MVISSTLVSVVSLVAMVFIFRKMGYAGWEAIVPFYNTYILFQELEGNGLKMFLLLIPLYNIYIVFKVMIKLANSFGQGTGFGIGLVLLAPIFTCILAFSSAQYTKTVY